MQNKSRHIFAVCDVEVEYAYNFMEYLNRKRSLPFEVQAFTGPEILCEFAGKHPIEILLISDKAVTEEVRQLKVGKLIILSEGVHNPELDQYPSVSKYQASDDIIREVMDCYGAEKAAVSGEAVFKKEAAVIGVYSPVGRTQKTSFAVTLGQILARERAVLYLNMESYSGFEELLGEDYERNLSDLLYYARQENTNLVHKLQGMVRSLQNLDYVPPAVGPMDIQEAGSREWTLLLSQIVQNSGYEAVILDLGDGVCDLFQILELCTQIYMPVRNDPFSTAKIHQFETLLRVWDYTGVLEKIRKIKLPFHSTSRTGPGYFEDLVWSELGDTVRQLLRKEPG